MQSYTRTAVISGSSPRLVEVECSVTSGFAGLQMVGNLSELCKDGKERAKTALERLGFKLGQKRILINLAPADCRKEGTQLDLPIAVSLSLLIGERESRLVAKDWLFAGELSLDGSLRPVRGVVPFVLLALEKGMKGLVLPLENKEEVRILQNLPGFSFGGLDCLFFKHLSEVFEWLYQGVLPDDDRSEGTRSATPEAPNFTDMFMPPELRELAVCAAVGRHNLLLRGTPGSGKSMFALRLPSLLPRLNAKHHFEALQLYSLKWEKLPEGIMHGMPPIRNPHHSSSVQALLGTAEEPGDMALAHGGVLFLDELPEFRRDVLEALREPMETGILHISRAQKKASWKADLQLIAACNNCPCGYSGSKRRSCKCPITKVTAYMARLSGPLLERIDIHYSMPEIKASVLVQKDPDLQKELVESAGRARAFMLERNGKWAVDYNRDLSMDQVLSTCDARDILNVMEDQKLSTRAFLKSLRVARTLADMEQREKLTKEDAKKAAGFQAKFAEDAIFKPSQMS